MAEQRTGLSPFRSENVGYLFRQTRGGVRVEPALAKGELPKTVKGFEPDTRSARFAYVGVATDAAGAARVVAALKVAAKKAAARKAAKA